MEMGFYFFCQRPHIYFFYKGTSEGTTNETQTQVELELELELLLLNAVWACGVQRTKAPPTNTS